MIPGFRFSIVCNITKDKHEQEEDRIHSRLMAIGELGEFNQVASESEGIRTEADVRAWMNEHNYIGTLYGVRFTRVDEAGAARGYTRQPQTTMKFE